MGIYVDAVNEFTRSDDADDERAPLGERLRGMAAELDIDSVEEVRTLRE